jgi:hypothetical protein
MRRSPSIVPEASDQDLRGGGRFRKAWPLLARADEEESERATIIKYLTEDQCNAPAGRLQHDRGMGARGSREIADAVEEGTRSAMKTPQPSQGFCREPLSSRPHLLRSQDFRLIRTFQS